jgi:hypothetical protein
MSTPTYGRYYWNKSTKRKKGPSVIKTRTGEKKKHILLRPASKEQLRTCISREKKYNFSDRGRGVDTKTKHKAIRGKIIHGKGNMHNSPHLAGSGLHGHDMSLCLVQHLDGNPDRCHFFSELIR